MPFPYKIISGGQTGADIAALDFAIENCLEHGGYVPKGRFNEAGQISARYLVEECESDKYPVRTELNVKASDATVIFTDDAFSRGTRSTAKACKSHNKPCMILNPTDGSAQALLDFVTRHKVAVLNVAGNRESKSPGIGARVKKVLGAAIRLSIPEESRIVPDQDDPSVNLIIIREPCSGFKVTWFKPNELKKASSK